MSERQSTPWRPDRDPEEVRVHCADCNGYLWSRSIYEGRADLIRCPYAWCKGREGNLTAQAQREGRRHG